MIDLQYISKGNKKTECFSFDLPAIKTCPGRTLECARDCYAVNMMKAYPNVAKKYERNLELARMGLDFVKYMIANIPANCQFRIHVSGDFYSGYYTSQWRWIAESRPDVTFYAYTRSWRDLEIFAPIMQLNALPNVNVNLSVDDETGAPRLHAMQSMRWCYLTKTDNVPYWIRYDDIIFRSNHNGQRRRRYNDSKKGVDPNIRSPLVKRLGGKVCPFEQGRDMENFSCAKCRLCVDKPGVKNAVLC